MRTVSLPLTFTRLLLRHAHPQKIKTFNHEVIFDPTGAKTNLWTGEHVKLQPVWR